MKIIQNKEDGSCHIYFSDNERKIINEKGALYLSDEALRHFGNHLVKIVSNWNVYFNKDLKKKQSMGDEVVTPVDMKE